MVTLCWRGTRFACEWLVWHFVVWVKADDVEEVSEVVGWCSARRCCKWCNRWVDAIVCPRFRVVKGGEVFEVIKSFGAKDGVKGSAPFKELGVDKIV